MLWVPEPAPCKVSHELRAEEVAPWICGLVVWPAPVLGAGVHTGRAWQYPPPCPQLLSRHGRDLGGVCCLRQVLTKQQQEQAAHNDFNFDHPDAFDFDLIIATLKKLKQGKSVKIPIYDFTTHSRKKEWVRRGHGAVGAHGWEMASSLCL